ncbi:flagellar hook-basal body protein [Yoonia vestfoldensis]|uniref:Flagellar basal-body rod protein FlgG n=1 Tax=Yoonia vestfoldensis SKA53 TaxID=314232 RepID=A3V257_9RHOB|nr:flagellar hook basal-body protein [Yoonia vestfoldensis]EAQ07438.1 flagellar basal-body rod protein FlgG [Yoonia vestfoldensis SKA53]
MFGTIKSGMATSMFEIAVVSNNVANSGTTAFRKSNTSFSDLYSGGSADSVARLSKGVGSIVDGTKQSTEQGGLLTRDGVLNLALIGKGMFVSAAPSATAGAIGTISYTRDGEFSLDKDGQLRTSTNDFVMGYGPGVTPAEATPLVNLKVPVKKDGDGGAQLTALEIGTDGKLMATYGSAPAELLGTIAIASFPNEIALRQIGMNRFLATDGAGTPKIGVGGQDGFGMIQSGTLETSNVDLTIELTDMIRAQQQFSGSSRILQTYSDMIEKLTR